MRIEEVKRREAGHLRLCAAAAVASLLLGMLGGWNMHENSDVRASYIAGLPSCEVGE